MPSELLLYLRNAFQGPVKLELSSDSSLAPPRLWLNFLLLRPGFPHNQDRHCHSELCGLRNSGPRPFLFHRSMRYGGNRVIFLEEMNEEIIPTIYHWWDFPGTVVLPWNLYLEYDLFRSRNSWVLKLEYTVQAMCKFPYKPLSQSVWEFPRMGYSAPHRGFIPFFFFFFKQLAFFSS